MLLPTRDEFLTLIARERAAQPGEARTLVVPLHLRLLADQLTPVLAYRRLVSQDERTAPSFLFESVEGGERQGRHSLLGAQPAIEVIVRSDERGHGVEIVDHRERAGSAPASGGAEAALVSDASRELLEAEQEEDNPLFIPRAISRRFRLVLPPARSRRDALPATFLCGWVGFAAYDTVRFAEPEKLSLEHAPPDDRALPDLHFAFYDGVVIFDHVDKLVHLVQAALVAPGADAGAAYDRAERALRTRAEAIQRHSRPLPAGELDSDAGPATPLPSNVTRAQHAAMVAKAKEYIAAGDIFQVVLGQRFERSSSADPFDVYRALRVVNPSPYMVYLQAEGCILVASSPEILCRVRATPGAVGSGGSRVLTNRPLAGTRRRGVTPEEDAALQRELLADPKERAEHIMLVDLGRNDVGSVCAPGTVATPALMEVERYSHVMHISSTVTGELRQGLDCWDALAATLPVGTISGAPKIRAMQIIDELEPVRRGPYGGGVGYVGLDGNMDIALALRTMVVPTALRLEGGEGPTWTYHLQAAGGIVADSDPEAEYQETVNKAAALARAIDVAERAFAGLPATDAPATDADPAAPTATARSAPPAGR